MNNKKEKIINKSSKDSKQKNRKAGFITKAICSIFKVETYTAMAAEGFPRAFKYLCQIILIFAIVFGIYNAITFKNVINEAKEYIQKESPNISYENGILDFDADKGYELKNEKINTTLIVNTNKVTKEEKEEYENSFNKTSIGIIVLDDRVIISNQKVEILYTDIFTVNEFNKQDIINHLNEYSTAYIIMMGLSSLLGIFAVYLLIYIANVLVLSLTGIIASRFVRIRMRYVAIFNMSVYAITLSALLELIYAILNMFTTFNIEYFEVMFMGVATIYLITAMFMLKLDHIEHQKELLELIEVQKQVKKEMEEEKENKEKQKKKEKEKEEKSKENEEGAYNEE